MAKKKFLRRIWNRYSKLGKRKKKKQIWRSPKGRHNKMRLKRKSYGRTVSIGYRSKRNGRGMIKEKIPKLIRNLNDAEKIEKKEIAIIGKIGRKKRNEIIKKLEERGIEILNREKIKEAE